MGRPTVLFLPQERKFGSRGVCVAIGSRENVMTWQFFVSRSSTHGKTVFHFLLRMLVKASVYEGSWCGFSGEHVGGCQQGIRGAIWEETVAGGTIVSPATRLSNGRALLSLPRTGTAGLQCFPPPVSWRTKPLLPSTMWASATSQSHLIWIWIRK